MPLGIAVLGSEREEARLAPERIPVKHGKKSWKGLGVGSGGGVGSGLRTLVWVRVRIRAIRVGVRVGVGVSLPPTLTPLTPTQQP